MGRNEAGGWAMNPNDKNLAHTWSNIPSDAPAMTIEELESIIQDAIKTIGPWKDRPIRIDLLRMRSAGLTDAEIARFIEYLKTGE
jgi:hypothetical protein